MPRTGCRHAVDCSHYEPQDPLSRSAEVGSAISEDPDTGLTELNVDFSLSCEPSRPTSHGIASALSRVHMTRPRLSLRGLLQFLWNEAELTRWKPAFAGKRSWAVVRHHLLRAAAYKALEGQPLSNVMFVPESFSVADKEEIAARRARQIAHGLTRPGQRRGKMLLIGEVKEIVPGRSRCGLIVKHLPDLPFSIDADNHRRMIRNFENELSLWLSTADAHLMIAATFSLAAGGQPMIDEMSFVPTSGQWIPADDAFELRLVNRLVQEGRSFRKSPRLTTDVPSLSPSVILLDVPTAYGEIRKEDLPASPR